jgi:hypothetical protein
VNAYRARVIEAGMQMIEAVEPLAMEWEGRE